MVTEPHNPRQLAFLALRAVHRGAFADAALDKVLRQVKVSALDRRFLTELVYGSVRRQRTLDAMIDQLAKKKAQQQPADLRAILHLGLYQLCYLNQIPASAAVNTTVDLAKQNGFSGLSGFVNGLLRQYLRLTADVAVDSEQDANANPLRSPIEAVVPLPPDPVERLGILYSYPDWIVQVWLNQIGLTATEQLCLWLNQPPQIDLRVNCLRTSVEQVELALQAAGVAVSRVPHLPQALRLLHPVGAIQELPGFQEGWWMVQDSSAQLVSYLLTPQSGEMIVDACAAPGGKTMHLAELMGDQGQVWACDRTPARLQKLHQNAERLGLHSIQICPGDSRNLPQFIGKCDRVLLDAPCSGLGTLHRHADARWRQTPESVQELSELQYELLVSVASWLKQEGVLVYATCTLHPTENEQVIQRFLAQYPDWAIEPPLANTPPAAFTTSEGWVKVWPYAHQMDGFFMVRLRRS